MNDDDDDMQNKMRENKRDTNKFGKSMSQFETMTIENNSIKFT